MAPRLLLLATETSYVQSHKQPLIEAAQSAGYDVWVASGGSAALDPALNVTHVPLKWSRAGSVLGAAAQALPECFKLDALLRRVRPQVLHNIALKPAVIGSLAALGQPVTVVNSINGLGYLFVASTPVARLAQSAAGACLRAAQQFQSGITLFQNEDDAAFGKTSMGLRDDRVTVIAGSGIDVNRFSPGPEPPGSPIRFAVLSRMLAQKGIDVAVDAARLARAQGHPVELVLCGLPDRGNPSALSTQQLERWAAEPEITWLGQVSDVQALLNTVHAVIQPSLGGEGLPKALLEGAAMARPLIATDVPGNRAVVRHEETGLRVPPGDRDALCKAMVTVVSMGAAQRRTLGAAARSLAAAQFSSDSVRTAHERLYRGLLRP